MPENITELTVEELQDAINDALDNYKGLNLSVESSDEDIARAEDLAESIKALRAQIVAKQEAAEARKAKIEALNEQMAEPAAVEQQDEEAVQEPSTEDAPIEIVAEDTAPDPVAETVVEEPAAQVEAEAPAEEPVPVAASAEPSISPTKRAAANAPSIKLPKEAPMVALTAAADVPGFATGAKLETFADVGEAVVARMRSFPTGSMGQPVFNRYGTAHIRKEFAAELSQDNYRDDEALLNAAADPKRLPGGSLVAAGGWCAPSETMYDFCSGEAADGLLSIPEVQVTRGGIRFAKGADFAEIFATGFDLTEAQVIALDGTPGKSKPCYDVACPTPEEVRLNAVGICIKAGILTYAAYPELVADVIRKSLVAHELRINAGVLGKIKTAAGAALTPVDQASTVSSMESLVWVAISLRTKYGLPESYTVEVVLPQYARQSFREDLARRNGQISATVTDAQINSWFADRNLAVQFVRGLDDLDVSTTLQVKPPATVTALVYPAGAFVKGTSAVITLDSVYDSTNLASNTYTALFSEEGYLVANRCYGAAAVTIPVCDSGRSGAADLVACFGTAETAGP
jgi:hypothetical protein